MVELTHNGERYMVDGCQWYRLLDAGERRPKIYQFWSVSRMEWMTGNGHGLRVMREHLDAGENYRVPCTDPRPPFVVGQRVKVCREDWNPEGFARGNGSWYGWRDQSAEIVSIDGDFAYIKTDHGNKCRIRTWCLDAVSEPEQDGYTSMPFKKVGTINVKFKKAVPLSPRTMVGNEDEPCLISPLEAAIAAEGVQLTQEESDRIDEIIEKGLARPTVEIPVRVSEPTFGEKIVDRMEKIVDRMEKFTELLEQEQKEQAQ